MNPELLIALDLGFGMGLFALAHVLVTWALLAIIGQGGQVAKVSIMFGFGGRPLFLRKIGNTWLELGYLPGSSLQSRNAEMELYDSLYAEGTDTAPQPERPEPENQSWEDLQAQARDTPPAAYTQKETPAPMEAYSISPAWNAIFAAVSLAMMLGCLAYAHAGTGVGEGMTRFFQLLPATLGQLFWIGDKSEWISDFTETAIQARLVPWGMAWIILATNVASLTNLLSMPFGANSAIRKASVWVGTVLGAFVFVRIVMLAASLTDSFWSALVLYLLGGFACQFVLYWAVLYGLRALTPKAA